MSVRITLVRHDDAWHDEFVAIEVGIRRALHTRARLVEHVGSTSVPDLVAKPTIDVALAVDDPTAEESYVPQLEAIGYRLVLREPEWYEHRLMKDAPERVNLHVFGTGCEEIDRMLAFRDQLRESADDRGRYGRVKTELAGLEWPSTQDYANAKSEVVASILANRGARSDDASRD